MEFWESVKFEVIFDGIVVIMWVVLWDVFVCGGGLFENLNFFARVLKDLLLVEVCRVSSSSVLSNREFEVDKRFEDGKCEKSWCLGILGLGFWNKFVWGLLIGVWYIVEGFLKKFLASKFIFSFVLIFFKL